ncbi:3-dehydrosphinganine reductase [Saitozyma podzolica]|uniref:3-dehydrosphinganine reductase n=1 Tax=Saitozyma podzolica TaxID=1890683 RepID=A0A427Y3U5_9TREE|nr:3-dehydrosphinganine reductase [Saitozyma podzolica]
MHSAPPHVLTAGLTLLAILIAAIAMGLFRKPLDRVYITGGSSGLGRALAVELVRRGAHVTVVARDLRKLEETTAALKPLASPSQLISHISADLTSAESSEAALNDAVVAWGGKAPDHVYLCAGFSRPKFFVDMDAQHMKEGLDGVYWVSAYTAHAAVKRMVAQRVRGKIVFVSSFLGYTTFAGYTSYSPGKYALRGLADALRSEMLLHNISVHIFMSAGILGPGFDAENEHKPAITRKIEEGDKPDEPEVVMRAMISGIEKGHYQITNLLITDLIRVGAAGPVPGNGPLDFVYSLIGGIEIGDDLSPILPAPTAFAF